MQSFDNPIEKFFDDKEYMLESEMAMEYLTDTNQKIMLYPVNPQSNIDDLYHEAYANEIVVDESIELNAIIELKEPTNQTYNDNNTMRILEYGNLEVHVLNIELLRKKCRPKYGDYVVYMVNDGISKTPLVFQIANDGSRNFENSRSWGAFRPHFRSLICTPVDKNEIQLEF